MSECKYEEVRKEHALVHLTITVPVDIVQETYTNHLKQISKDAHIKGFRKGKVPVAVLEQKFGIGLRAEATDKIIQNSVKEVLEKATLKPLHYSTPKLEYTDKDDQKNLIIDTDTDFSFTISYDTEPTIVPSNIDKCTIEECKITITEEDIETELKEIQERNAISSDTLEPIAHNNIVTYSYVELDENQQEIESSKREDYTTTIGTEQDTYNLTDDLVGMKKDEEKIVTKIYPENYHYEAIASKTLTIKITISKVKTKELPPIDDELAQDVSDKFKTLTDLKKHITVQLEEKSQHLLRDLYKQNILDYLVKNSSIEVPQSAVSLQLESMWKNFVQQYGGDEANIIKNTEKNGNIKEQLFEMWTENAKIQITEQLLIHELLQLEKIEISDETVEKTIKKNSEKTGESYETVMNYYTQHNLMPQFKYDLQQKTLFDILKNRTIIKETKELSFTELVAHTKNKEEKGKNIDE